MKDLFVAVCHSTHRKATGRMANSDHLIGIYKNFNEALGSVYQSINDAVEEWPDSCYEVSLPEWLPDEAGAAIEATINTADYSERRNDRYLVLFGDLSEALYKIGD